MRRLLLAALLVLPSPAARAAPPTAAPAADEQISVAADSQEWVDDTWRGVGDVHITYQDISIRCEEMELNRSTMDLVAQGGVTMEQGKKKLTADEVRFNLRTKTGVFLNATAFMPPSYSFTGARMEKLDDTHYRLEDGTFTTCEPSEHTPWEFRTSTALIEEEGYGYFYGTAVRIQNVPVFYLPYLVWPVKMDRTTGLLVPSFGYSQRRGGYLGNALYLALGRSYDSTVYLDLFSKGDFGIGNEWRWAPAADARGEITGYTIRDRTTGLWQWKFTGKHQQADLMGFRMLAEVDEISDIDFFQEFERSFDQNARRDSYSYLYLTRSWGPYALNIRSDRRVTFLSTNNVKLHQLPEVELRVRPTRIGLSSLYWSLVSSANLFNVDRGGDLKATYGRIDAFPSVSYTLPGPSWLSLTPNLGARATYYTKRYTADRQSFEPESIDRSYVEGGVALVGPSFSRIFSTSLGSFTKLKHLIEPRIDYRYVSDSGDTSQIPVFDEVDSSPVANVARVTLANRLFGRAGEGSSAREIGSLELFQDYSFDNPLNRSSDGTVTSQRGPLGATLRLNPSSALSVDARASYDTLFSSLRSTSLSASVTRKANAFNLTWYQAFSPATGDRTSSQVRAALGVGGHGKPVRLDLHVAYDIDKGQFLQQHAQLSYQGSCWGVALEYRDLRASAYPTRDYRITVDFKGIGKLLDIQGGFSSLGQ